MRGQMTHPGTDLLAEFRAGLIAGRRGRRIGAHVAGCDRCAALGDRLAGVSALLAGVPPPVIPPGVAQRLDAVLAAEAERKADPERAGGDGLADRAADARPARHRGFRLVQVRLLAPAAAVMLAAAGYGLSQIGPGPSPAPPPAPRAALIRPALYLRVVTTGTDYLRATIRQQLEAELRSATPAPSGQPASLQVRACVLGLTSKTSAITEIRVEKARLERPALVIIASTAGAENVWVAGPGCSAGSGDVLYSTALPVQDPESIGS